MKKRPERDQTSANLGPAIDHYVMVYSTVVPIAWVLNYIVPCQYSIAQYSVPMYFIVLYSAIATFCSV